MGGIWHQAGCCCGDPCEDCTSIQPSAEVTVDGVCDAWASAIATGEYLYVGFFAGPPCTWSWELHIPPPNYMQLNIQYNPATGIYVAWITTGALGWPRFDITDVTNDVSCGKLTGLLAGAFDLPGQVGSPGEGCTAHVTLGG